MLRIVLSRFIVSAMLLQIAIGSSAVRFRQQLGRPRISLSLEYEIPHEERVTALAFSRDGKRLATSAGGDLIRIWDSSTGKELQRLREAGERSYGWAIGLNVFSLAFSPDGNILACAGDLQDYTASRMGTEIELWDLSTGHFRAIKTSTQPKNVFAKSIDFAPDGRSIYAALGDYPSVGEIDEWDVATGAFKKTWKKFDCELLSSTLSPDGKAFATVCYAIGRPLEAALWDVRTGKMLQTLQNSAARFSLSFSPDGKLLASSTEPPRETGLADGLVGRFQGIVINDLEQPLFTLPVDAAGSASAVAFSPDGLHIASGDTGDPLTKRSKVKMWRIQRSRQ